MTEIKVYVFSEPYYEGGRTIGIFSTKKKAEKYRVKYESNQKYTDVEELRDCTIEETDVDNEL